MARPELPASETLHETAKLRLKDIDADLARQKACSKGLRLAEYLRGLVLADLYNDKTLSKKEKNLVDSILSREDEL